MGLNQISRNMCQFLINGKSQYFFNFATASKTKIEQPILQLENRELSSMEGSGSSFGFTLWCSVNACSGTWKSIRMIFRKYICGLWKRECRKDWRSRANRQFRNDIPWTVMILSLQNPRFLGKFWKWVRMIWLKGLVGGQSQLICSRIGYLVDGQWEVYSMHHQHFNSRFTTEIRETKWRP